MKKKNITNRSVNSFSVSFAQRKPFNPPPPTPLCSAITFAVFCIPRQYSNTSPKRFKTTPKFVTFKLLIYSNVPKCILVPLQVSTCWGLIPRGGTPYNGLYREASPEMGTFLRLQVRDMKRQGFHLLKYMKGQRDRLFRSVISGSRRANRCILWL